jgi:MocE subfamily Rieske [2Fe-2S] domain protein
MSQTIALDYSLTGVNAKAAIERGLAEAEWYTSPVPKAQMRQLLERKDGPAVRDTVIWFALLAGLGWWFASWWGSAWAILPLLAYSVLYGTTSDSRWHECGHGTAFKSDWMNTTLYEIASFMVMRESVVWRWSHNRHHSDTIIVGRDPEIQIPRPPNIRALALSLVNIGGYMAYFPSLFRHAMGRMTDGERTFIPESEFPKVCRNARICLAIYAVVITSAVFWQTWTPIFLFVTPQFLGTWLMIIHNTTQHAGLAENVLDHRLNCRTVYMNPISRFIYWNMNYHVEHHMFPLVPYHALPRLHEIVKPDMPKPYFSILDAWRELLPAVLRQRNDPAYHVKRQLPARPNRAESEVITTQTPADAEGWLDICEETRLGREDILRFDHARKTYAIYRDAKGALFATDGICTHGNNHLVDGLIKDNLIECPKHNGRFKLADGSPARAPVCRGLATHPVEARKGRIFLNPNRPGGVGARSQKTLTLRIVSAGSVSTFIRELVFEPVTSADKLAFTPGDYLQFDIPPYNGIHFREFDIPEPYASVWETQRLFGLKVSNTGAGRRNNYSLACDPSSENLLRFNVRIAMPPPGQDCPPGVGSAYMFNLKPGDEVTAIGPFGDFHIKPTQREMVYIGGGSGMAPLRSHISHLFETQKTARKVSFWYGARSRQELFYHPYFTGLAARFPNFRFEPALSSPLDTDAWQGHRGFIHEVVLEHYLKNHASLRGVEFYLCGPPQMIRACLKTLEGLGVGGSQISYDEF